MKFLNPVTALAQLSPDIDPAQDRNQASERALGLAREGKLQLFGQPVTEADLTSALPLLADARTLNLFQILTSLPNLDGFLHTGDEDLLRKTASLEELKNPALLALIAPRLSDVLPDAFTRAFRQHKATVLVRLLAITRMMDEASTARYDELLRNLQQQNVDELTELIIKAKTDSLDPIVERAYELAVPITLEVIGTPLRLNGLHPTDELHQLAMVMFKERNDVRNAHLIMELAMIMPVPFKNRASAEEDYRDIRKSLPKGQKKDIQVRDLTGLKGLALNLHEYAQAHFKLAGKRELIRALVEDEIDLVGINQLGAWSEGLRKEIASGLFLLSKKVGRSLIPDIGPFASQLIRLAMGVVVPPNHNESYAAEVQEIDFLARNAKHFSTCALCRKRAPDAESEVLNFHRHVTTRLNLTGVTNHYETRTFPVPRCTTCVNYKHKGCARFPLWLIGGTLVGAGLSLLIPLAIGWQLLIGIPSGLLLGGVAGFVAALISDKKDKNPNKPKYAPLAFPPVQELLTFGWKYGEPV
jgi:hypothetical protein